MPDFGKDWRPTRSPEASAKFAERVDELRESSEPLSVTIYLFDRFGRMQPIDYLQFFEEFAARTRGLKDAPLKRLPAARRARAMKDSNQVVALIPRLRQVALVRLQKRRALPVQCIRHRRQGVFAQWRPP